jgi:opacity protein-like surface antigen
MKNSRLIIGIMSWSILIASLCPSALAETGKRFSLGVNAGGGAITWMSQSWRAGLEFGYRFNTHLAAAADLSFGALTLENSSSSGTYQARDSQKWTTVPVSLSLLYVEPVSENASVYLGAGIGYHFFTRTITSETNVYGQLQEDSQKASFNALAPQVSMGLEFALGKSVSLKGDLRYVFGTASRKETVNNLDTRQDINFGGASLTLGVRIFLF